MKRTKAQPFLPESFPNVAVFDSFLQTVVRSLVWSIQMLRLVPPQVLAVIAWSLPLLALLGLYSTGRETVQHVQELHKIPCSNCQFFTNDHRLKCPVHPHRALTEEAVDCQDFEAPRMT